MGYKTNCGNYGHLENNLFIDTEKAVWFQRVPQARYLLYGMDKWKDASDQWGPWGYSEGKKYVQNENWKEYYIDTHWAPFFTDFSIDLDVYKRQDLFCSAFYTNPSRRAGAVSSGRCAGGGHSLGDC